MNTTATMETAGEVTNTSLRSADAGSKAMPERRFVNNADESCRMFKADWMEALSHVRPWVPHVLYVPVIVATLWLAFRALAPLQVAGWFAAGLLVWTILEYVIHRWLFHPPQWIEDDTRRICSTLKVTDPVMPAMPTFRHKFYFMVHGVHHDYPNDSTRLVMPPSVSIPLAIVFWYAFRAAFGLASPAVFAGLIVGYLAYDTIHHGTHHASASSPLARIWKKRHFRHHYANSERDFGVSNPLWDVVFGTKSSGSPGRGE